mmetsp:Transcript_5592/g.5324  ORF Transcript_5592/g.5324 Transcript_5592/m.5324 type:complete len:262 (+) Transcript_5592:18-803(+)
MYILFYSKNLVSANLKESGVSDLLLGDHTDSSKHSKSSVVQFLCLHLSEFLWISGLKSKRIEANISWVVVRTKYSSEGSLDLFLLVVFHGLDWFNPSNVGTSKFSSRDGSNKPCEEERSYILYLGEVAVRRSSDGSSEERVKVLSYKVSKGGKHTNTTMKNLGLTESLDLSYWKSLGESERVEVSKRCYGSWKSSAEGLRVGSPSIDSRVSRDNRLLNYVLDGNISNIRHSNGRSLGRHGGRGKSSSASNEGGKYTGGLHF